ncbi:hypothetical protein BMF94_3186 [Rhodotorula taiwanensis]|uniref:UDP-N-acetylglucosamine transferase subunit ALG14 n=1 Tax=Rhodotorula taiwanensis TaxID=741276 RepID=A0A2S5BA99_9BASI|nr:hypothetical protein BMF94_3186 [Rhodotorula taiwanensis]
MPQAWDGRSAALAAAFLVCAVLALAVRSVNVVIKTHSGRRAPPRRDSSDEATLAVFLGSGGHTAEMMRLTAHLDWNRFTRRTWIISSGDSLSESKALALEKSIGSGEFRLLKIPRARRVHQSYLTSPFTTLYSLAFCLWHISLAPLLALNRERKPVFADLVLLNGPGSCVPIACATFLPRIVGLPSASLVYIESLARTRRLSLSAQLVRPLVDRFFVQWDSLRDELVKAEARKGERPRWKAKVECQGWLV